MNPLADPATGTGRVSRGGWNSHSTHASTAFPCLWAGFQRRFLAMSTAAAVNVSFDENQALASRVRPSRETLSNLSHGGKTRSVSWLVGTVAGSGFSPSSRSACWSNSPTWSCKITHCPFRRSTALSCEGRSSTQSDQPGRRFAAPDRPGNHPLAIRERVFGKVHPQVASTLNELGGIALTRGRFDEAEALSKRVLVIYRTVRSEEHTSELQSLAYLVCRLLLEKKKEKSHTN